jgi:hypothetical protein
MPMEETEGDLDVHCDPMIRRVSRAVRLAATVYVGLVLIAGMIAAYRLAGSTEMPGLAAWELLVLALPWSLILEAPVIREAGALLLAAIVLGGAALNAGLFYMMASMLERWPRRGTRGG